MGKLEGNDVELSSITVFEYKEDIINRGFFSRLFSINNKRNLLNLAITNESIIISSKEEIRDEENTSEKIYIDEIVNCSISKSKDYDILEIETCYKVKKIYARRNKDNDEIVGNIVKLINNPNIHYNYELLLRNNKIEIYGDISKGVFKFYNPILNNNIDLININDSTKDVIEVLSNKNDTILKLKFIDKIIINNYCGHLTINYDKAKRTIRSYEIVVEGKCSYSDILKKINIRRITTQHDKYSLEFHWGGNRYIDLNAETSLGESKFLVNIKD